MKRYAKHLALLLTLLATPLLGTAATLDAFPDPTRPAFLPLSAPAHTAPRVSLPKLELQSTLVSADRRVAVINGVTLAVGARIGDARVVSISPGSVVVSRDGRIETLRLMPSELVAPLQGMSHADAH